MVAGKVSGAGRLRINDGYTFVSGSTAGTAGANTLQSPTGTVVLSGNLNDFTGGVDVVSGKLLVNNVSGSGTGTGTITVGATGAATSGQTATPVAGGTGGVTTRVLNGINTATAGTWQIGQTITAATLPGGSAVITGITLGNSTANSTIAISKTITVAANNSTAFTDLATTAFTTTATLGGSGVISGQATINAGGTITAGAGATAADLPATFKTAGQVWKAGGTYAAKFKNNTAGVTGGTSLTGGTAATWDTLAMGALNLTALSAGSRFNLTALLTTGGTFEATANRLFKIASATSIQLAGGTLTADTNITDLFTLNTAGLGITSDHFSVLADFNGAGSTDLVLQYETNAAPEPTTAALLGLGLSTLLGRRRRRAISLGC